MKTETFLPVFTGYYGTLLGDKLEIDESELEYLTERENREIKYDDLKIDYKQATEDLSKKISLEVIGKLIELDLIKSGKFQNVHSPKFYNFSNDSINVEFTITQKNIKKIEQLINENFEAWAKHLKEYLTSCSGFTSFHDNYPESEQWIIKEALKHDFRCGFILNFLLELKEYTTESIYYDIEFYISEYTEVKEIEIID